MYAIFEFAPGLWQITLPKPAELSLPAAAPTNVYLVDDPRAPALINAGHPAQFETLCAALREIGVAPSALERIVYTSWSIDVLGGASRFPEADHFAYSPDMLAPRHYDSTVVEPRRHELRALAEAIVEEAAGRVPTLELEDLEEFLARQFPPVAERLRLIPLRSGHFVRLGSLELEVLETPGPERGHLCLYDAAGGRLWTGHFSLDGRPDRIVDTQPYLRSLERIHDLDPDVLLPNRGRIRDPAGWTLKGAHRFLNNFLSNAPAMMFDAPTLLDFVEQDLGFAPDHAIRYLHTLEAYRTLLDELVRSRMIEARGEGLERRYGVDVEDPRARLRTFTME
jgi:glyoxylase-like metal-dependent hydrolase (beta-lactamase superfamily II)